MSRVGNQIIPVANGVTVSREGDVVTVKGPKGTLSERVPSGGGGLDGAYTRALGLRHGWTGLSLDSVRTACTETIRSAPGLLLSRPAAGACPPTPVKPWAYDR